MRPSEKLRKAVRTQGRIVTILPTELKTPCMRQIELRFEEPLEVRIVKHLHNRHSQKEIADEFGVTEGCISRWIRKLQLVS